MSTSPPRNDLFDDHEVSVSGESGSTHTSTIAPPIHHHHSNHTQQRLVPNEIDSPPTSSDSESDTDSNQPLPPIPIERLNHTESELAAAIENEEGLLSFRQTNGPNIFSPIKQSTNELDQTIQDLSPIQTRQPFTDEVIWHPSVLSTSTIAALSSRLTTHPHLHTLIIDGHASAPDYDARHATRIRDLSPLVVALATHCESTQRIVLTNLGEGQPNSHGSPASFPSAYSSVPLLAPLVGLEQLTSIAITSSHVSNLSLLALSALSGCGHLTSLDLSHNDLSKVSASILCLTHLQTLQLHHNQLEKKEDLALLRSMKTLKLITLWNNPLVHGNEQKTAVKKYLDTLFSGRSMEVKVDDPHCLPVEDETATMKLIKSVSARDSHTHPPSAFSSSPTTRRPSATSLTQSTFTPSSASQLITRILSPPQLDPNYDARQRQLRQEQKMLEWELRTTLEADAMRKSLEEQLSPLHQSTMKAIPETATTFPTIDDLIKSPSQKMKEQLEREHDRLFTQNLQRDQANDDLFTWPPTDVSNSTRPPKRGEVSTIDETIPDHANENDASEPSASSTSDPGTNHTTSPPLASSHRSLLANAPLSPSGIPQIRISEAMLAAIDRDEATAASAASTTHANETDEDSTTARSNASSDTHRPRKVGSLHRKPIATGRTMTAKKSIVSSIPQMYKTPGATRTKPFSTNTSIPTRSVLAQAFSAAGASNPQTPQHSTPTSPSSQDQIQLLRTELKVTQSRLESTLTEKERLNRKFITFQQQVGDLAIDDALPTTGTNPNSFMQTKGVDLKFSPLSPIGSPTRTDSTTRSHTHFELLQSYTRLSHDLARIMFEIHENEVHQRSAASLLKAANSALDDPTMDQKTTDVNRQKTASLYRELERLGLEHHSLLRELRDAERQKKEVSKQLQDQEQEQEAIGAALSLTSSAESGTDAFLSPSSTSRPPVTALSATLRSLQSPPLITKSSSSTSSVTPDEPAPPTDPAVAVPSDMLSPRTDEVNRLRLENEGLVQENERLAKSLAEDRARLLSQALNPTQSDPTPSVVNDPPQPDANSQRLAELEQALNARRQQEHEAEIRQKALLEYLEAQAAASRREAEELKARLKALEEAQQSAQEATHEQQPAPSDNTAEHLTSSGVGVSALPVSATAEPEESTASHSQLQPTNEIARGNSSSNETNHIDPPISTTIPPPTAALPESTLPNLATNNSTSNQASITSSIDSTPSDSNDSKPSVTRFASFSDRLKAELLPPQPRPPLSQPEIHPSSNSATPIPTIENGGTIDEFHALREAQQLLAIHQAREREAAKQIEMVHYQALLHEQEQAQLNQLKQQQLLEQLRMNEAMKVQLEQQRQQFQLQQLQQQQRPQPPPFSQVHQPPAPTPVVTRPFQPHFSAVGVTEEEQLLAEKQRALQQLTRQIEAIQRAKLSLQPKVNQSSQATPAQSTYEQTLVRSRPITPPARLQPCDSPTLTTSNNLSTMSTVVAPASFFETNPILSPPTLNHDSYQFSSAVTTPLTNRQQYQQQPTEFPNTSQRSRSSSTSRSSATATVGAAHPAHLYTSKNSLVRPLDPKQSMMVTRMVNAAQDPSTVTRLEKQQQERIKREHAKTVALQKKREQQLEKLLQLQAQENNAEVAVIPTKGRSTGRSKSKVRPPQSHAPPPMAYLPSQTLRKRAIESRLNHAAAGSAAGSNRGEEKENMNDSSSYRLSSGEGDVNDPNREGHLGTYYTNPSLSIITDTHSARFLPNEHDVSVTGRSVLATLRHDQAHLAESPSSINSNQAFVHTLRTGVDLKHVLSLDLFTGRDGVTGGANSLPQLLSPKELKSPPRVKPSPPRPNEFDDDRRYDHLSPYNPTYDHLVQEGFKGVRIGPSRSPSRASSVPRSLSPSKQPTGSPPSVLDRLTRFRSSQKPPATTSSTPSQPSHSFAPPPTAISYTTGHSDLPSGTPPMTMDPSRFYYRPSGLSISATSPASTTPTEYASGADALAALESTRARYRAQQIEQIKQYQHQQLSTTIQQEANQSTAFSFPSAAYASPPTDLNREGIESNPPDCIAP